MANQKERRWKINGPEGGGPVFKEMMSKSPKDSGSPEVELR
jgi:hypothetical protein